MNRAPGLRDRAIANQVALEYSAAQRELKLRRQAEWVRKGGGLAADNCLGRLP